jgi:hypothetical protein
VGSNSLEGPCHTKEVISVGGALPTSDFRLPTWSKLARLALLWLACFLAACSVLPTPPPPTTAPERRQAQIATMTQVAADIAATAEIRSGTQTAKGFPPTVTPTPTVIVPKLATTQHVAYTTNGPQPKQEVALLDPPAGSLQVRGAIQVNHITAAGSTPQNRVTVGSGACHDCQVLVIGLQINLTLGGVATNGAQNLTSLSYSAESCADCELVARALQVRRAIVDPSELPPDLLEFALLFQQTIEELNADPTLTAFAAEQRINALLAQYPTLQASLSDQRAAYPR